MLSKALSTKMKGFFLLTVMLMAMAWPLKIQAVASGPKNKENGQRPSIGLTLSGGGARGLAHIGVLHVIDSLGIPVDYISGTSMGSIVGGMYAAGNSAAEIEQFALEMNWLALLSRSIDLNYIHPSQRASHRQFILEFPIEEWQIKLSTGAIEGQQLWNKLNELFFHVYDVRDFSNLPIAFACVATDVETGEAVVMKDGDLVSAIRGSMAIPSVFTTVEREGLSLIDGGVSDNFPVKVVREMGAEFVIGVNVSQGLRPARELQSAIDIIYQMGFYSDARSFSRNRELTDLYIEPSLGDYTAASFGSTAQIIELGKIAAREQLDRLGMLAGNRTGQDGARAREREEIVILVDSIRFFGLGNIRPGFAQNTMGLSPGDSISSNSLTRAINRLYATNYFERVHYQVLPGSEPDRAILVLDVIEKPLRNLTAAFHFSSFTGAGIVGGIGTSKLFFHNVSASARFLLGEKPAFDSRITYFTSERRRTWLDLQIRGRQLTFPLYDDFERVSEYNQGLFRVSLSANRRLGANDYLILESGYRYQYLSPNIRSPVTIVGNIQSRRAGIGWNFHSLDKNNFPESGQRIDLKANYIFDQQPSFHTIRLNDEEAGLEDLGIRIRNFVQARINWQTYLPLGENTTQISHFQLGYNFNPDQGFINGFNLGGTHSFLENQHVFTGLSEYEIISSSLISMGLGWQLNLGNNVYARAKINAAGYDFSFRMPEKLSSDNLVFGGGLSLGYNSLIGPIEITLAYSPTTNRIRGYLDLGWGF